MKVHRRAVLFLVLPLAVLIAAGVVLQSRRAASDVGPRRSAPRLSAPIRTEPAPRPAGPLLQPPAARQESPLDATSRKLLADLAGAQDPEAQKTALFALSARQPGNAELTRRVCALTSSENPPELRRAAYTALRFRPDDPTAAAALLAAFPNGTEAERFAAAQSLSFQRLPDMPQRLQVVLAGEPSLKVQKELKAAIAYMLNQIKPEPCLTKP